MVEDEGVLDEGVLEEEANSAGLEDVGVTGLCREEEFEGFVEDGVL